MTNTIHKKTKTFFSEKACKRGHFAPRLVSNGCCTDCMKLHAASQDVVENRERAKAWYKKNQFLVFQRVKKWKLENPEKVVTYRKNFKAKHPERCNPKVKPYKYRNPEKRRAWENARRAQKIKAMPAWADKSAIMEFYKNCPDGCHVDHIIPLSNKNVCGLHVLKNLQYLPAKENLKKRNNFDGSNYK